MDPEQTLAAFFDAHAPLDRGDTVLVAFSGGADSTALLAALVEHARRVKVRVAAAHVDHGIDSESNLRSELASRAAARLGLELIVRSLDVPREAERSESIEMAARRVRYRELTRVAESVGARYLATGHHRDDQAETVLLRIAAGHGVSALGSIPARRGFIVRPFLDTDRERLVDYLDQRGLTWIEDPANRDLEFARNRIRHGLKPALADRQTGLNEALAELASAAVRANARIAGLLDAHLAPTTEGSSVTVSRSALEGLPAAVRPFAVVHLLRCCGSRRRPSRAALDLVSELLTKRSAIGVDLGASWRIEDARGGGVRILRIPDPTPHFAYNLSVPGEVRLGELSSSLSVGSGSEEPWMFRGESLRAAFSAPLVPGDQLTVRNRRPGDRVQPLGSSYRKKLKDLLIDHGIPQHQRDRIPLLCRGNRILWVPGVTIDHNARLRSGATESPIWVAEIVPDE